MIEELWLQLGAVGFMVVGLVYAVIYLTKRTDKVMDDHTKERKEWRKEAQAQTKEVIEVVKSNTSVVSELSTIIKSRRD